MLFYRSHYAYVIAACATIVAFPVAAQNDVFAPLRTPPPDLEELFAEQPQPPSSDLSEAVDTAASERLGFGGEPQAHVLLTLDEPLTEDLRSELAGQGIQIIDKYDSETWIATIEQGNAEFAVSSEPIGSVTPMPPQAKVSDTISLEQPFEWQRREGQDRLGYSVLFHKGVSAEEAVRALNSVVDNNVQDVDPESFPYVRSVTVDLTSEELLNAASLDVVLFIEPQAPPDIDFNLNNTQPLSNVDDVQGPPYNLSGAGITVGIWESGDRVRPTHVDLAPRVTVQPSQTTSEDGHALHVAGTIGGSGANFPNAEGMAPQVNILSWDSASDTAEMAVAAGAGAANPIIASNHSYGARVGWDRGTFNNNQNLFGSYNNNTVAFDTIVAGDGLSVQGTELVIVKSAGNDRGDGPGAIGQPVDCRQTTAAVDSDCIGPVGSAKNIITVGAMNGGAQIAGFSGFGPTDDGRIKPDIMANGTNVTSLGDFGVPPGGGQATDNIQQTDNGTWVTQGTSMSAPAVTGIVALMAEEFANQGQPLPLAAGIKAILVQTAQDVANIGQATPGPDFATGWGIADAQAAIDLLRLPGGPGYAEGTLTATGSAGGWERPFVVPPGLDEMQVTLAWSDLPGTPTGIGSELVNDLDLRLLPPGGDPARQPWTLNPANPTQAALRNGGDDATNNVEQVSVLNPDEGTWRIRVTAKPGSLALGPQQFAVAGPISSSEFRWSGAVWSHTGIACSGQSCPGWRRLDNNVRTVTIAAGNDNLYQLHHDGVIWESTGVPCNGTLCPGWRRLDNNPRTLTITAGGDNLYQLHNNGWIWRYTGVPCSGGSCPGWQRLDNNPRTMAIAATDNELYQLHRDGRIWVSTGTACAGDSCPGWRMLDNNPRTITIAATDDRLFQLHHDGRIWEHTGVACSGQSCPGWRLLDNNPRTVDISANGGELFQRHRDGLIWAFTGQACSGNSCPGWRRLDNNPRSTAIDGGVYQNHHDGRIWSSTGQACSGNSCPGWRMLDNNPRTKFSLAADNADDMLYQLHAPKLYQLHDNGAIWQSVGDRCNGDSCGSWQKLDNNPRTRAITASGGKLYQLHEGGRIWQSTGEPCNDAGCPGWRMLDNNPRTMSIISAGGQLYQLHDNGAIWRSTGTLCQGNSCPGWTRLDNNPRTVEIVASGGQLYQRHQDGRIWRFTGIACSGNSCPGWVLLDNNPRTQKIAAAGGKLYQLHDNGRIWESTGQACSGNSCHGWRMMDNNPRTAAIIGGGPELYQLHDDGRIWESTGGACSGNSCPGWRMMDNNPRTQELTAASGILYQRHDNGAVWRSDGRQCTGNSCPGWQRLDNNPRTVAIEAAHQ